MAIYHLHTEPASRSNGKNAIAMAAYRSGGRLRDDRTGEIKDYSKKQGIIGSAIFYPNGVEFDRQTLWNFAEKSEIRKDARVAREIRIALPHELEPEARFKLVNDFALGLVDRYGIAVDASIHEPDKQGDNRNFHAHLMLTTRQISAYGLGEKSDLEKSNKALKREGKSSTIKQIKYIREEWENLCNMALERQGREERITAKSYKSRGMNKCPTIHLGPAVTAMERKRIRTRKATFNRAVRKQNLQRVFVRKMGRLQREIEATEREILELRREIEREQRTERQAELAPREERNIRAGEEGQEREIARYTETIEPEKPALTISELLERHQQKTLAESTREKRLGDIEDLLNHKQECQEKDLKRDEGGIDR